MVVLTAKQIKAWDEYTVQHEPVSSIDLMERAALKCVEWLEEGGFLKHNCKIFCGKGNNGGDGLAIARNLFSKGLHPQVYILDSKKRGTEDFETNLQRLRQTPVDIFLIQEENNFPELAQTDLLIDAIFGIGLNSPVQGLASALVHHLNRQENIISIDLPSGLFADRSSKGLVIIEAKHTLSFQVFKTALLVSENAPYIGVVHILDIGLHPDFLLKDNSRYEMIDESLVKKIFKPRLPFAHKGTYGHALIIGGSYGKIGALVLATTACLRSGAGLVTAYFPKCGYNILQTSAPEAMVITDSNEHIVTDFPHALDKYNVIGIGPGLGTEQQTQQVVSHIIDAFDKPLVIDADALNCLSLNKELLHKLCPNSIITPHPKEFERLFGNSENDFDVMDLALQQSNALNIIIVLKGHHTFIAMPDGRALFNNTGNAGMAKGGSGDVLTGIITSLCAQNYTPVEAAILGVYVHGLAGDLAATALSKESMLASDIVNNLSGAFQALNKY